MNTLLGLGFLLAGLAALVHVYIFVLESVLWTRPATRKVFGIRTSEEAQLTRPLAFNQGFYNLFLALAIAVGIPLSTVRFDAGIALVLAGTGSMVLAAVVLIASRRSLARAAAVQGLLPLIAVILVVVAIAIPRTGGPQGALTIEGRDRGLPAGVDVAGKRFGSPFAVSDAAAPGTLELVLFGSSSCPPVPESYDVESSSPLRITLGTTAARVCSADLAATTFAIEVPDGFEPVTAVDLDGDPIEVVRR